MLQNKVAFITGAGRGIGREIALLMAGQGADIVAADIGADDLAETGRLVAEKGVRVSTVIADITKADKVRAGVDAGVAELGRLDILVNNAAIFQEAPFLDMTEQQWQLNLNVNLTGVFNVTRAVAPILVRQKSGCVVSISSIDAFQGCRNYSQYAMAKAGVVGLTRTLAQEFGPFGVRVNAVAPGIVETDMTRERVAQNRAQYEAKIPLGRVGQPRDIARAALFLASDLAEYITGQVIHVNGGAYFG